MSSRTESTSEHLTEAALRESEARYRALTELSPDAILVNAGGRFVFANAAAARLLNAQSVSDLIGRTSMDSIAPEYRELVQQRIEHVRAGKHIEARVEQRWQRLDGSLVDVEVTAASIEWSGEQAILVLVRDITDRKQADRALRSSEERLRNLFEQSLIGMAEVDLTGRFIRVNERYCQIVRRSCSELLALRMQDITHPEDLSRNLELFGSLLAGVNSEFIIEKRYVCPNRSDIWVHNSVSLLRDSRGQPHSIVALTLDITDRKAAEFAALQRERLIQIAMRAGRMGAWEYDLETRENIWHEGMAALLGYPAERATIESRRWMEILHPEDRERVAAEFFATLSAQRESWTNEFRVTRADGAVRWMSTYGVMVTDPDQRRKIVGISQDITDRKQTEDQLRRSHDTFYSLVQNNPFGVYVVDGDFRLRQVSAGAQKVFEKVRPLLGRDFAEVLRSIWPEPFATEAINRFRHTLATGESYNSPRTVEQRQDIGVVEAYDWRIERIRLPDGSHGVVCYFYDLSERQQWEMALRASEERLREADRRKDEFLATLAHELRNPLAPIRNAVQVLKMPGTGEPQRRWCRDVIDRQVNQMARLLDDLLDVSRITRGKIELRKERMSIHSAVEAAIEAARPLIDAKAHTLRLQLPAEPLWVAADPTRMTQILGNLLTNAAKYTPPGGRIRVVAAKEGNEVVISVQDNGIGMTEAQRSHLFEMFAQAPEAIASAEGGLGVGLAITQGLVELHGGNIEARSEGPGKGSEFIVRLPTPRA